MMVDVGASLLMRYLLGLLILTIKVVAMRDLMDKYRFATSCETPLVEVDVGREGPSEEVSIV